MTRTFGHKQVMDELDLWKPAIQAEYDQLVKNKKAVVQKKKVDVLKQAEECQMELEVLPAKMVYTRKAGTGAYRTRAVVCGNYSQSKFDEDKYASGSTVVKFGL